MGNMPALEKKRYGLLLKVETVEKCDHVARASGFSRNEVIQTLLDRATVNVELTPEEVQAVADTIKENTEKRNNAK